MGAKYFECSNMVGGMACGNCSFRIIPAGKASKLQCIKCRNEMPARDLLGDEKKTEDAIEITEPLRMGPTTIAEPFTFEPEDRVLTQREKAKIKSEDLDAI